MPTPASVLTMINGRDSTSPRITCYDDVPGPTAGERIELSGRVLGTWVNKAGNALQEEWDIEPGSVVRLSMQPHWRLLYWAWAVWSVGAHVDLDADLTADLVVTDDAASLPDDGPAVLVTRGALARSAGTDLTDSTMDEAADLASFGDDFMAWQEPDEDDLALTLGGTSHTHGAAVADAVTAIPVTRGTRLHLVDPAAGELVRTAMSVWAGGGSLVLQLGAVDPQTLARRATSEGATTG
ncbi:TIGR03089 family protein [Janibacter alittae]|uniref:TIGR03089 family protein n=1 Tax=Janibacter alittae TaxID=3115209 RepID=A0ABZ2MES5_9MICO